MSVLIDKLVSDNRNGGSIENTDGLSTINFHGRPGWVIAKPIPYFNIFVFISRLHDAWRVLSGRSFAVHYFKDR
jgi:hypothetical protein